MSKANLAAFAAMLILAGLTVPCAAQSQIPPLPGLSSAPASGKSGQSEEIPSIATCKLSAEDLAAGRHAYCGYLKRFTLFHDNEMDRFLGQMTSERGISAECAKQAIEQAQNHYMADALGAVRDCYGVDPMASVRNSDLPKCVRESLQWATKEAAAGRNPTAGQINEARHRCEAASQP